MAPWASRLAVWSLACCGLGSTGCLARHIAYPVEVSVRDAETGHPVPGATVGVKLRPDSEPITAMADADGKAVIKVRRSAMSYDPPVWQASAPGYLATEETANANYKSATSRHIKLHQGPARLVVTIPDGYQGPVLIDKRLREKWLQVQQGKREFEYRAKPNGYVAVDASPLMLKWLNGEGQTRLADSAGQTIPESSIRRVLSTPAREILVVGDDQDARDIQQAVFQDAKRFGDAEPDPVKLNELFRKYREEAGVE